VSVKVISKFTYGEVRFLLIATIFSNTTDFIAIIASSLRMFCSHENPFESRISRYVFSQNISCCN